MFGLAENRPPHPEGGFDGHTEFLKECCGGEGDPDANVTKDRLYEVYEEWAGKTAMSKRRFGEAMIERGYPGNKKSNGQRVWPGLRVQSGTSI
jgi:phage/plasmid-associated DNA primase